MKKPMMKIGKTIGKVVLNYFKLFLIPFVFIFMVLALVGKGIILLIKKATA
ncbi:MAG: hypothetical protein GX375_06330 [Clostridiales bacterium]|nr:hypothetical protein [Clostridiales bacterium]